MVEIIICKDNMTESRFRDVTEDDRKRFQNLFDKLDTNKDGTLDVQELASALGARKDAHGQASVCP